MGDRPILFSAPMVRAILAGTKTQTRRAAKLTCNGHVKESGGHRRWHPADPNAVLACPYGQPADRLWVRETHAPQADCWGSWERWMNGAGGPGPIIHYAADMANKPFIEKWRPSIHMPRWASRITLEVTGVRVERLQDISEADALAEGIVQLRDGGYGLPDGSHYHAADPRISYWSLWEHINGPGTVGANQWVWAVEFKRIEVPAC